MAKSDISKQTVAVLVFLAIIISLLGMFTVVSKTNDVSVVAGETTNEAQGTVKLTIAENQQPQASAATGMVTLKIFNAE